jgi:immunity protein 53 of polymorphic toxin system
MLQESALTRLAKWYGAQCDRGWEHRYGITIETLDNPGWILKVDLADTNLQVVPFESIEHRLDSDTSWWRCWREGNAFNAACGAMDLPTVIDIFLTWANQGSVPRGT